MSQNVDLESVECTVLVVGGGTGGTMAALTAAQEGAKTILVEQGRALGGIGTVGGIHNYHYGLDSGTFPTVDRRALEIGEHLGEAGTRFHPEGKRTAVAQFMEESGVRLITGQPYQALMEGDRITGIVVQTDMGPLAILADVIVDSTSDGDIASLAGAEAIVGREWDEIANHYSYFARVVTSKGAPGKRGSDAGWVDVRDMRDVTRAYLEARARLWRQMQERTDRPLSFLPMLSLRAGRYILGEYVLTLEDVIEGRSFPDGVMLCYSNFDPHALDYANESELAQIWAIVCGLWGLPLGCQIPFRCFLPKRVEGIIIGSRAISLTADAAQGVRMQRDVQVMGEVAGVAAVMAAREGVPPRLLDISALQRRLQERGVTYAPDKLSELPTSKVKVDWKAGGRPEETSDDWFLQGLATPDERKAVSWWLKEEPDVLALLGTPGEGKALWHIYRQGEEHLDALRGLLASKDGLMRRAAAFALALLDRDEGTLELITCVRRGDQDAPSGRKTHPRWLGALALITKLRATEAFDVMLEILASHGEWEAGSGAKEVETPERLLSAAENPWIAPQTLKLGALLYALHYFHRVLDQLDAAARERLSSELDRLLASEVGDDWLLVNQLRDSIRWSIETTAAGILARLGDPPGKEVLDAYRRDPRRYVRNAANKRWKEAAWS